MRGPLAPAGRHNRAARRILIALATVAVLGNLTFFLVVDRLTGEPLLSTAAGQSQALVLVEPIEGERILTATRDDELILMAAGEPVARARFASLIEAIVAVPDSTGSHRIAVGASDGTVVVLDDDFDPVRELRVEGRVVGLTTTSSGDLIVGHGVGAFGDQYFVSFFPEAATEPTFSTRVGFTISGLIALGDSAIFGTLDSRVGAIPIGSGEVDWTTTLRSPITRLLAIDEPDRVLAGSENGDLTLLDAEGATRWTTNVSSYPIRGLAFDDETGTYVVGDARGNIIALDDTGQILLTREVAEIDVEAVLPTEAEGLLVVPREGAWQTLHPGAIGAVQELGQVRVAWLLFNVTLLISAIVAGIVAVERWRLVTGRQLQAIWRSRLAYLFLLPAMGLIVLFSYYPAGLAFYYSLTNFSVRTVTEFVGLANYREVLFEDTYFRTGLINMVIIVFTSILKTITVPLLVAQLIFWLRNSVHQYFFRTLFVLPAVVPDLVFTLMWRQVYDPNTGLLNQLLGAMGVSQFQRAWLGEEETAIWAIVGVGFPFVSAFAFLIFLGGLLSINSEYFDAAKVDGARWWQRLRNID
ncbi:MAG: ABC transporter permease subunit, partial [Thermomicrobiales bacterium]